MVILAIGQATSENRRRKKGIKRKLLKKHQLQNIMVGRGTLLPVGYNNDLVNQLIRV